MFDEKDSHESAIGFLTFFQEAIQATVVVEPGKTSFDFPPLTTVPFFVLIFGGAPPGNGDVVFAIRGIGNDPAVSECAAQGFTIIAFIEPQALRPTAAFPNFNTIKGFP